MKTEHPNNDAIVAAWTEALKEKLASPHFCFIAVDYGDDRYSTYRQIEQLNRADALRFSILNVALSLDHIIGQTEFHDRDYADLGLCIAKDIISALKELRSKEATNS